MALKWSRLTHFYICPSAKHTDSSLYWNAGIETSFIIFVKQTNAFVKTTPFQLRFIAFSEQNVTFTSACISIRPAAHCFGSCVTEGLDVMNPCQLSQVPRLRKFRKKTYFLFVHELWFVTDPISCSITTLSSKPGKCTKSVVHETSRNNENDLLYCRLVDL